jgi:hypothetical protein
MDDVVRIVHDTGLAWMVAWKVTNATFFPKSLCIDNVWKFKTIRVGDLLKPGNGWLLKDKKYFLNDYSVKKRRVKKINDGRIQTKLM